MRLLLQCHSAVKSLGNGVRKTWPQVLALPLAQHMTLGEVLTSCFRYFLLYNNTLWNLVAWNNNHFIIHYNSVSLLSQFLDPTWCPLGSFTWLHSSVSLARVQITKKASLTCLAPQQGGLESLGTGWPFLSFLSLSLKRGLLFCELSLSLSQQVREASLHGSWLSRE